MSQQLASIDLGSNTFRLSFGTIVRNGTNLQLQTEDHLRVLVAMAAGLDQNMCINQTTLQLALASLNKFAHSLQGFAPEDVRCVATNTFRVARNAASIVSLAEQALGYPIEVISGQEEARLIYLGVSQHMADNSQKNLVIDIGGGSTELIIGQHTRALKLASLQIGCTTFTRQFFVDGKIRATHMQAAIAAARKSVRTIAPEFKNLGWSQSFGSSGTAKGLLAVLQENGFSTNGISLQGMERLSQELIRIGTVRLQDWAGLKPERVPLLAGGLAIMQGVFMELGIDTMQPGFGALRQGVLQDLFERRLGHTKVAPITRV